MLYLCSILILQKEFTQSLEMQNESQVLFSDKVPVAYRWRAGERKGCICLSARSWRKGGRESIVVNKLGFSVHTDKYMHEKCPNNLLAVYKNTWSNIYGLIKAYIYLKCWKCMLKPDTRFITTVWFPQWNYMLFLISVVYKFVVLKMKLKCINGLLLCKSSWRYSLINVVIFRVLQEKKSTFLKWKMSWLTEKAGYKIKLPIKTKHFNESIFKLQI